MQLHNESEIPQGAGEMIEATATVIAVEAGFAVLETQRNSACSSCGASAGCGTSVLGEVLGRKQNLLRIDNDFDAVPGEQVIIGLAESDLLLASLAAYMLPIAGLIIFALAGLALGIGDVPVALGALAGFALGLYAARHLTRNAQDRFTPRYLRRAPYSLAGRSCAR